MKVVNMNHPDMHQPCSAVFNLQKPSLKKKKKKPTNQASDFFNIGLLQEIGDTYHLAAIRKLQGPSLPIEKRLKQSVKKVTAATPRHFPVVRAVRS